MQDSNWFDQQTLVDEFTLYFPFIARHAVVYRVKTYGLLEMDLDDGTTFVFDWYDKSLFQIKDDDSDNEKLWRKHFKYKLVKLLFFRRMSQKKLSELTGISEITISKYMNGTSTPSLFNARKIARALNVDINELIDI